MKQSPVNAVVAGRLNEWDDCVSVHELVKRIDGKHRYISTFGHRPATSSAALFWCVAGHDVVTSVLQQHVEFVVQTLAKSAGRNL